MAGLIFGIVSFYVHVVRLKNLEKGKAVKVVSSIIWLGLLMFLVVVGMSLELFFAIVYPYLKRSQTVEVSSNPAVSP